MSKLTVKRPIELSESSWELLDEAARVDGDLGPNDFIESLIRGLLQTDDGELCRSMQTRTKLRDLFGNNHG